MLNLEFLKTRDLKKVCCAASKGCKKLRIASDVANRRVLQLTLNALTSEDSPNFVIILLCPA